jgi:hypothetical protein
MVQVSVSFRWEDWQVQYINISSNENIKFQETHLEYVCTSHIPFHSWSHKVWFKFWLHFLGEWEVYWAFFKDSRNLGQSESEVNEEHFKSARRNGN